MPLAVCVDNNEQALCVLLLNNLKKISIIRTGSSQIEKKNSQEPCVKTRSMSIKLKLVLSLFGWSRVNVAPVWNLTIKP